MGFPGGASGKEPARQCRRHETWVRSLGGEDPLGKGMATHCLENSMDRGAWWATLPRVAKSRTRLKQLSMQSHTWAACEGWSNSDQRLRPTPGSPAPSHPQPRLLAQGKAWHPLSPGQKPGRGSRVLIRARPVCAQPLLWEKVSRWARRGMGGG